MYVMAHWKVAPAFLRPNRHDTICKSTPRGNECGFVMIGWVDLNLVVARESIHKGESLVADAVIDNLIDERRWEVVLGTCVIEIMKVGADMWIDPFFLSTGTGLEAHEV
jgi:hypothetical protein